MSPSSFAIALLSFTLICQLLSLQPTFTLSELSYGTSSVSEILSLSHITPKTEHVQLVVAKQKTSSIVLVGDIMMARNVEFLMQQKGSEYPFSGLDIRTLAPQPYIVGNFESSIPLVHVPTNSNEMNFSVDRIFLPALLGAGFTHLSLANNHTYDHGAAGLMNTEEQLSKVGFYTFGEPNHFSKRSITYLDLNERKVALIGLHATQAVPSKTEAADIMRSASTQSDFQIVYVHWGTEYIAKNDALQRQLSETLVAAGADLIIGHHPHVVENVGLIDGVPVFYSLGNYIFDQYLSIDTEQGLVVTVEFTSESPVLHLLPVTSEVSPSQPRQMKSIDHARFLKDLADRSDPVLKQYIEHGLIPMDSLVATSSKIAMID